MLAPLKDRGILEREEDCAFAAELADPGLVGHQPARPKPAHPEPAVPEPHTPATLIAENRRLAAELRRLRRQQREAALAGARQAVLLRNRIASLLDVEARLQARLRRLESGQAVVALGQRLMAAEARHERICAALAELMGGDGRTAAILADCRKCLHERQVACAALLRRAREPLMP